MNLERFDNPETFHAQASPFLLAREAEHNLILGLSTELRAGTARYPDPPYLAVVRREQAVVAVALRTPPHPVIISYVAAPDALDLLARDLQIEYGALPGVNGESSVSQAFADIWQQMTGQSATLEMGQRIYKLETVIPASDVPGTMRRATQGDFDLLRRWIAEFHVEAVGVKPENVDYERIERTLTEALKFETLGRFLWEHNGPVSLAGFSGPTPNGIRIGPVYTPPEHRRRGYASTLVAALSQQLLDEGRKFCFLYTDLANPTSNHVYMNIGYQPVCDVNLYHFD